jgi:hypothetical protein
VKKYTTHQKVKFLQRYIRQHYKEWIQISPKNIVGFKIDKKIRQDKELPYFAIIFQVKNKKEVNDKQLIPPFFMVEMPNGQVLKVRTDVQELSTPQLHIGTVRKPKKNGKIEVGTAGLVISIDDELHVITNYHVAAYDRLNAGELFFQGFDDNISVDNQPAAFVEGIFSDELDVAFVSLAGNNNGMSNELPNGLEVAGFVAAPLSPGLKGKNVTIYGRNNSNGVKAVLSNVSVLFNTGLNNYWLEDVLEIKPRVTAKGDSGGIVLLNDIYVLGIIVGGTPNDDFSYAIPFHKIDQFKSFTII